MARKKAASKQATGPRRAAKADGDDAVLETIAAMPEWERAIGERLHAIIRASAPELSARLWYGQPAYAKRGKVICFFRGAEIDKERYVTPGMAARERCEGDGAMDHDRFIGQVQDRAGLGSRGAAERVTRATLETLGERLDAGAAGNLAAQLPTELGEHLRRTGTGPAEQMDLQRFLTRVGEREQVDYPEAVFHARCVVEVLDEATTEGVTGKVREQLSADFDPLFESGSTGSLHGAG